MKKALITGVTGQDGAYLAEFLLKKGYQVHGLKRRSSSFNTGRIDHLYVDPHLETNFFLHHGDLTDSTNLAGLVGRIRPDEIYNLGAMSHVQVSFEMPEYVAQVDALGTLRILEAIRAGNLEGLSRFYQASTSELYGMAQEIPQTERTAFYPRSPYGVAKLYSYWITVNYREAYDIFACNGILFNHESPLRGETFVTRKITMAVAAIERERCEKLYLGNLESRRDWGYAKEYVEGMWKMLQQEKAEDFVLATGKVAKVRDFVEMAFACIGIDLEWDGEPGSLEEKGICRKTGKVFVEVDPRYFRPTEVEHLVGDARKAKEKLGWEAKMGLEDLVRLMVQADRELLEKKG